MDENEQKNMLKRKRSYQHQLRVFWQPKNERLHTKQNWQRQWIYSKEATNLTQLEQAEDKFENKEEKRLCKKKIRFQQKFPTE